MIGVIKNNILKRSLALLAYPLESIINWPLQISNTYKIMIHLLIIFLFLLGALWLIILKFIEEDTPHIAHIVNDEDIQKASDQEKIRFVAKIIDSIKLNDENRILFEELREKLNNKLDNKI